MEEKNNVNTPLNVLTDKYVNGDICYDDFEKEVKALYSCKEESKPTLKPFDLEAAKQGNPVFTRDGRRARIICWDIEDRDYPIAAAVFIEECEIVDLYTDKGEYIKGKEDERDLMMLPEKKELFDKLAEAGKRWNPETKQLEDIRRREDIRWRAENGCGYYVINSNFNVSWATECNWEIDFKRYESGNYFKTKEAAQKVADQIKEILKNSKAE